MLIKSFKDFIGKWVLRENGFKNMKKSVDGLGAI